MMSAHTPAILVVNAGSSSLKFAVFLGEENIARGQVERIGVAGSQPGARVVDRTGQELLARNLAETTHAAVLEWLLGWLTHELPGQHAIAAVGHRVVHGADTFSAPVRVSPEVYEKLRAFIPLAPLHQPYNLGPIGVLMERHPEIPQVACFDTAFHATQDHLARMFALPRAYWDKGVKRYGFHGLSYEFIAAQLPTLDERAARGRTIVCHLGNGSSACGMFACKSVATTMGFTALEGLMMGTRTGALDPGVLLYMLDQEKLTPAQVSDILYKKSGLLGVSGLGSDMRDLLGSPDPAAAEAVDLFCYRITREIGSLAAALGGLDGLVFTGGIGEHAAPVRQKVCERLGWTGLRFDAAANQARQTVLHTPPSQVSVLVVPTNEERMIARHTARVLGIH